jgi:hypothetical protein
MRHSDTLNEQLQTSLNSRVLIEQAKGKLAERPAWTWTRPSTCCAMPLLLRSPVWRHLTTIWPRRLLARERGFIDSNWLPPTPDTPLRFNSHIALPTLAVLSQVSQGAVGAAIRGRHGLRFLM